MHRISLIAKCFVWMAALLAPAQTIYFATCSMCDHCRHGADCHEVDCRHHHVCDAACRQGTENEVAASDSLCGERSHCHCKRTTQPQQASSPGLQIRTSVAVSWIGANLTADPSTVKSLTAPLAQLRHPDTAQHACARLCRFLM